MAREYSSYVTYKVFKLAEGSRIADAIDFFIYDTIKIFLLLTVIIFIVSVIRSYFPPERTKKILSHKKEFIGNILAALLGVVTPFALSFLKIVILRKVLKIQLLITFVGIMTATIIAVGYLFNAIL